MPGVGSRRNQDESRDALHSHHPEDADLVVCVFIGIVDEGHIAGLQAFLLHNSRERSKNADW